VCNMALIILVHNAKNIPLATETVRLSAGLLSFDQKGPLVEHLLHPTAHVRLAALEALSNLPSITDKTISDDETLVVSMWALQYDTEEANVTQAKRLWALHGRKLPTNGVELLELHLTTPDDVVSRHTITLLQCNIKTRAENVRKMKLLPSILTVVGISGFLLAQFAELGTSTSSPTLTGGWNILRVFGAVLLTVWLG